LAYVRQTDWEKEAAVIQRPNHRQVKYQAELDTDFGRKMAANPSGVHVLSCIQCGACSSACPMSIFMDYTPRQIIGMIRAGMTDDVLRSQTVWLCASCYACTVNCPRQIKITDLMYSLKQRAIQENAYPKRYPIPVLAREFFNLVQRNGRTSEGRLMTRMYLKTNPLHLFKQAPLALKLMKRGRMSFRQDRTRNQSEVQSLLRCTEKAD
jgi:heterodisulfide reductase subunit C